jgi:hypothetical protein
MSKQGFSCDVACQFLDGEGDHRQVRLLQPLDYTDRFGSLWSAPAGLISDGASIPRQCWTLIGSPYTGPYRRIAFVHDAAYQGGGRLVRSDGHIFTYTRSDADSMLREGMLFEGASIGLADTIYEAVRQFGGDAWREDAAARQSK